MHTFHPTTWGTGGGGGRSWWISEFEACLVYSVPSQSGFVRETLSEKNIYFFLLLNQLSCRRAPPYEGLDFKLQSVANAVCSQTVKTLFDLNAVI